MIYVECPDKQDSNLKSLFLAGSISGANDWQKTVTEKLKDLDIVVYNPRRKNFDTDDPGMSKEQIAWEYENLREADAISFWFAKETDAPITLYELGAHSMTPKPIIVGIHPEYPRKIDVEIQTKLVRSDIPIVYSLDDLVDEIYKTMGQVQLI